VTVATVANDKLMMTIADVIDLACTSDADEQNDFELNQSRP